MSLNLILAKSPNLSKYIYTHSLLACMYDNFILKPLFKVFDTELEKVGDYADFSDFCHTFSLMRGKSIEEEESSTVGEFKVYLIMTYIISNLTYLITNLHYM